MKNDFSGEQRGTIKNCASKVSEDNLTTWAFRDVQCRVQVAENRLFDRGSLQQGKYEEEGEEDRD